MAIDMRTVNELVDALADGVNNMPKNDKPEYAATVASVAFICEVAGTVANILNLLEAKLENKNG